MVNKWFISDTHFFHTNIIKFCKRPFADTAEMNEVMIQNWNDVVKPQDNVYHLGDVAMGFGGDEAPFAALMQRLNGHKRLIVGNHDKLKSRTLRRFFEKIDLWKGFHEQGFTCVHIPLQIEQLRDGAVCVHGHIHNNLLDDPRYINVCVEHTNYTPIHMDELIAKIGRI